MELPSVPSPEFPYRSNLSAGPCNRPFPYSPPQRVARLQEQLRSQRAQNKLAKAFDETLAFWNSQTARAGSMYDIIDTADSTNVGTLNLASANLTTEDFDPYEQRHTVHTRNYKGYRVVATCANSKHQGGVAVL